MEILIHSANLLYLLSYTMRDILWLRVLTVVAAIFLICFFFFRPETLWTPIYWNIIFIVLNTYWIVRLLYERRPVPMTEEESKLYELAFKAMTPRQMLKLLNVGNWQNHSEGKRFTKRGTAARRLSVISKGRADIEVDGKAVGDLREGQFIGTLSFISDEPASASVIASHPTRCLTWPTAKLKKFLGKNPELREAFQRSLNKELIRRLRSQWAHQN